MQVNFITHQAAPERQICEAELVFDDEGPLARLRLVGFALWRGPDGETYVSFPARPFGVGGERRYYNYLRGDEEALKRFKRFIVEAFHAWEAGAPVATPAVASETERPRAPKHKRA